MTTDITNVQMAFMMCTRVAVRAPLNLIFSFAMTMYICSEIAPTFLIAVIFLMVVLGVIMVVTLKTVSYTHLDAVEYLAFRRVAEAHVTHFKHALRPLSAGDRGTPARPGNWL